MKMRTSPKILVLLAVAMLVTSPSGFAQISGTQHDFSADAWNTTGEICVTCHAPHNNLPSVTGAPMWNHEESVQTYTLYGGGATLEGTTVTQPAGTTKLCLSCHDGSVALENFGGTTTGTNFIPGTANVTTDLSDDHPVSVDYLGTAVGLFDQTTSSGIPGGSTIGADMLFAGKVECASCHDVHNEGGLGTYLLKKTNAGSALCMTCHNK